MITATGSFAGYGFNYRNSNPSFRQISTPQHSDRALSIYNKLELEYNKRNSADEKREYLKDQLNILRKQVKNDQSFADIVQALTKHGKSKTSPPTTDFHKDLCLIYLIFVTENFGSSNNRMHDIAGTISSLRENWPDDKPISDELCAVYTWTIGIPENNGQELKAVIKEQNLDKYSLKE